MTDQTDRQPLWTVYGENSRGTLVYEARVRADSRDEAIEAKADVAERRGAEFVYAGFKCDCGC